MNGYHKDSNCNDKYVLTDEEADGVNQLRKIFKDRIPADLNTDLNLRRWIKGWRGKLDEIEPRLGAYIENRKAAKLDTEDYLETFMEHPLVKKYMKYLSFSQDHSLINTKDNGIFIVERIENVDLNGLMNVVTCGTFLHMNFVMCEGLFRKVLQREQLTGRPSGVTILYDMEGLKISDFMNPTSPFMKVNKLTMGQFQDNYCELMQKCYVINAPSLFTILWDVVKHFMNENTQNKFIPLGSNYKEVLLREIDADILPVRYGGNKTDTSGLVEPDTLCNVPAVITEKDYFVPKEFFDFETTYLKPGARFEISRTIETPRSVISWQFWVNSEVVFAILKINGSEKQLVNNRYPVVTPNLPEEGEFVCQHAGEYVLEFFNNSTSWFSLRLEYSIKIEPTKT